jgi:Zn-dependent protease
MAPGSVGSLRLMGVPIRVHFTFALVGIFLVVTEAGHSQSAASYIVFLVSLLLSFGLHELGHAFAASICGIKTLEIVMYPTGGVARLERSLTPREEFWIAAAGPLVNGAIVGLILLLLYSQHRALDFSALAQPGEGNLADRIALVNAILGGFNLLPAFPLDGGRMLRAILSPIRSETEATSIAAFSGRVLALSLGIYGLFYQPLVALLAFVIYLGADSEGVNSRRKSLSQGVPVRAAMMTEYRTLSHASTIHDAANLLLSTSQQDFPVLHGDEVIGLLGRNALLRGMASEGPDSYIAGFMDREFTVVSPDTELAGVLALMTQGRACLPVMQDGHLVGLLTSENLSQFLLLRNAGLRPVEG